MKVSISLNRYPDNYEEEVLPEVLIEVRYRNHKEFNDKKAANLAKEIELFIKNRNKSTYKRHKIQSGN